MADAGPHRLAPGALAGRVVLVAGGAGAVGNAAIQLARWAGATVITTVSGPEKADLAHGGRCRRRSSTTATEDAVEAIRGLAPDGVDIVVEVAPSANAALNQAVAGPAGTIAVYATDAHDEVALPVCPLMVKNISYRFVLVYTVPEAREAAAVEDVSAAVAAGALRVGEAAACRCTASRSSRRRRRTPPSRRGAVGKVLIDVG